MRLYPWIRDALVALLLVWPTYEVASRRTEHDIAARYYHRCRENLGLFEPLTTLQNQRSACAALIEEELGIENRWTEEMP